MRTRFLAKACLVTGVLLTKDPLAQEVGSEIRTVVIDDFPVASPDVRFLAIKWRLDSDQDQFLTLEELDAVIADAARNVDAGRVRRHLLDDNNYVSRYMLKLSELEMVRQPVAAAGGELSLVSEDFHERFARLPAEQRRALLKADVDGDNDGTVTMPEVSLNDRGLFQSKPRFESDFGEDAYIEVLRLLGWL